MIKLLTMVTSRRKGIAYLSISKSVCYGVRVCHVVRFVHVSHVSVIILYYGQFHSFSTLITEVTLQCWRMHVRQYIYI